MATYDSRPSAFTQMSTTGEWEYMHSAMGCVSAIDASMGSAMVPSLDTVGRNAVIADGVVVIKGQMWRCDAPVSTPIPAASAQNRIDRLVLRLTRGATTSVSVVAPWIITGTPSGSPVLPGIQQTPTGVWDIPVCHWTSTSAGGLTTLVDDRRVANDQWHDMRPLGNSFVGTVAGNPAPQYRFSDDIAFVEVAGFMQSPPTAGNYNGVQIVQLPPAYRPIYNSQRWMIGGVADGIASPTMSINTNGSLFLTFAPNSLSQSTLSIFGRYPLDDQNGMIQM
jgi:hypothetical protein